MNNEQKDIFVSLLMKTGIVKSESTAKAILTIGSLFFIGLSFYIILKNLG